MSEAPTSGYPVRVEIDYAEPANRLTTFFRFLMVISHMIALVFYGIAAYFVFIFLWFVIMITGKRPQGPANFIAAYIRWSTRVNAYQYLLTDEYPPFSGDENPQ